MAAKPTPTGTVLWRGIHRAPRRTQFRRAGQPDSWREPLPAPTHISLRQMTREDRGLEVIGRKALQE